MGPRRQRALLGLLLLKANAVVSVDRLLDALWEGAPPRSAVTKVHGYVSALRRVLACHRRELLLTRAPGYMLQVGFDHDLDCASFEQLITAGRGAVAAGDHRTAAANLRAAVGLWRGQAVSDTALSPTYVPELVRLEELRLTVLDELFGAELASGRHEQVVPELAAVVTEHPLRESLRAKLMVALHRAGRPAEALASYHTGRRLLRADLGMEPSRELQRLQRAILSNDPSLEQPPRDPHWLRAPATAR